MALSVADFPDQKKVSAKDFPDQPSKDKSSFPDQHDNSFPSAKIASEAAQAIVHEIIPDINLPEAIGTVLKEPAKAAMDEIGRRKELTPYSAEDVMNPRPEGKNPAEMALDAAGSTLSAPLRTGATLQEPQVVAQGMTTEKLIKRGVNPYVANAIGVVAGATADPINVMAAADLAAGVSAYTKSRQALKMAMAQEDLVRVKTLADDGAKYESWLKERQALNGGVGEAPPAETGEVKPPPEPVKGAPAAGNVKPEATAPAQREVPPSPAVPTSSVISEETAGSPRPVAELWSDAQPPTKIDAWQNSAVRELGDLNTSLDIAHPTADPHADLMSTVRRYVGHEELARFDADKMVDEMTNFVPDRDRRMLVTLYSQLGRSPSLEEVRSLAAATEGMKDAGVKEIHQSMMELLKQDLSLNPKEQGMLKSYNGYFDKMGKQAKEMGLLPRLREVYGGPHLYASKEEASQGFIKKLITGRSRFARERTFDNVLDAVKAGYVPRTLDSAELTSIYHKNISKAAAEKYLMGSLEKQGLINFDGQGRQIKGFSPAVTKISQESAEARHVDPGLYTRQPYSDNPEVQKVMSRITEDPVLDNRIIRGLEKVNSWQKTAVLYMQIFHPKALAAEAIAKGFSPAKFKEGLDLIDQNPEYVRSMIRSGLVVNDVKDIGTQISSHITKASNYANPISFVRKINDIYTDAVFGKYMTGLKVYNSNYMMKRLMTMGVPQERAVQLAVEDSNRIFGGLNLRLMNRSPNMQRLFQLVSFAPDWTESKLRQMGAPFGVGMGDVTAQEAKILASQSRQYWVNLTALATVTHLANMINPANRVLSVDLSQESGFKDVKKLAMLATGNPIYFTSKASSLVRDMATLMDPHIRSDLKMKKIFSDTMPFKIGKEQQ